MNEQIEIFINGNALSVSPGTVVASAIAIAGEKTFRRSVSGMPRGPLCGMGVCMECRVTINGRAQCRSCQTLCEAAMQIRTNE